MFHFPYKLNAFASLCFNFTFCFLSCLFFGKSTFFPAWAVLQKPWWMKARQLHIVCKYINGGSQLKISSDGHGFPERKLTQKVRITYLLFC